MAKNFLITVFFILASRLLISCAGLLPHPTSGDLTRISPRWPQTSLQDLDQGRKLYIANCAGCHDLHVPSERSPAEWERVMERMQGKANIDDKTKDSILAYLESLTTKE